MTDADRIEIGRKLGFDLYRFGRVNTGGEWSASIVEGYVQAQVRHVHQILPDRYIKKWLQLRLGAYARNRIVDEQINPDLLMKIDVAECPILRKPLTHGELTWSDWSIDRLNNDGAYSMHNLAVMSVHANQAKGNRNFDEVYELSQQTAAVDGLEPVQWLRLASVMLGPCFAESSRTIPVIPLAAPIPLFTVRFATQVIQQLFTLTAKRSSGKNMLVKHFGRVCQTERSLDKLKTLADAVHFGLKGLEYPWDVWLSGRVMVALIEWEESLDERAHARRVAVAQSLSPVQQFSTDGLRSWNVQSGGYHD